MLTGNQNWIHRVDLTTRTVQRSVRQATILTRSADGSIVGYAESNISSGEWERYAAAGAQAFVIYPTGR